MASDPQTQTGGNTRLVAPTGDALVDALLAGSKWGTAPAGSGAQLSYAFPSAATQFDQREGVAGNYHAAEPLQAGFSSYLAGFAAFDAAAQASVRNALQAWAQVANLRFTEVGIQGSEEGQLRFAFSAPPGLSANSYGVSWFPQDFAGAGDTWINAQLLYPEGWGRGGQNFLTLLHEIGHALGLKHPHDTGLGAAWPGWPATPSVLAKVGDDTLVNYSTQNMVMAYNDLPGVGAPVQADYAPTTPMQVDIKAIQYLYGPNLQHNAGDTVYTYRSDSPYNETLWDAGGSDTIRVEGDAPAVISLLPGSWSQLGLPLTYSERASDPSLAVVKARPDLSDPRTVFIFDTVLIEHAIGGGGADQIIGNALNNTLQGRAGDDRLDGGAGIDTALYSALRAAAQLSRVDGGWRVSSAAEGSDTLSGIERLRFADVSVALDTAPGGYAAHTAQILRALFGSSALAHKEFVGIGLSLFDAGTSYADIVGLAIGTGYFESLAGSRSNSDFVRLVYRNVVGQAPDDATLAHFAGLLDSGQQTQASLALLACQLDLNAQSPELVTLVGVGIEFLPPGG